MNRYQATKKHMVALERALRALVEADEAFADGDPDGMCDELLAARAILAEHDAIYAESLARP